MIIPILLCINVDLNITNNVVVNMYIYINKKKEIILYLAMYAYLNNIKL